MAIAHVGDGYGVCRVPTIEAAEEGKEGPGAGRRGRTAPSAEGARPLHPASHHRLCDHQRQATQRGAHER